MTTGFTHSERYKKIERRLRGRAKQGAGANLGSRHKWTYPEIGITGVSGYNSNEPVELWSRACNGSRDDCRKLGLEYAKGDGLEDGRHEWGVPEDYVRARMYLQLAADAGDKKSKDLLFVLDKLMTPEEIETSHMLVHKWRARHPAIH